MNISASIIVKKGKSGKEYIVRSGGWCHQIIEDFRKNNIINFDRFSMIYDLSDSHIYDKDKYIKLIKKFKKYYKKDHQDLFIIKTKETVPIDASLIHDVPSKKLLNKLINESIKEINGLLKTNKLHRNNFKTFIKEQKRINNLGNLFSLKINIRDAGYSLLMNDESEAEKRATRNIIASVIHDKYYAIRRLRVIRTDNYHLKRYPKQDFIKIEFDINKMPKYRQNALFLYQMIRNLVKYKSVLAKAIELRETTNLTMYDSIYVAMSKHFNRNIKNDTYYDTISFGKSIIDYVSLKSIYNKEFSKNSLLVHGIKEVSKSILKRTLSNITDSKEIQKVSKPKKMIVQCKSLNYKTLTKDASYSATILQGGLLFIQYNDDYESKFYKTENFKIIN